MDIELLLDILGNETRREILQMLTERRCYVSQLSEELNIGQKAIISHLEIMEKAGLLEPHFEKVEKGRPRKYFHVSQNLVMEVNLFSKLFDVKLHSPCMDEDVLEEFPRIKGLYRELRSVALGERDIAELEEIREELLRERERLTEARKAVDFLLTQLSGSLGEERIDQSLKKAFR